MGGGQGSPFHRGVFALVSCALVSPAFSGTDVDRSRFHCQLCQGFEYCDSLYMATSYADIECYKLGMVLAHELRPNKGQLMDALKNCHHQLPGVDGASGYWINGTLDVQSANPSQCRRSVIEVIEVQGTPTRMAYFVNRITCGGGYPYICERPRLPPIPVGSVWKNVGGRLFKLTVKQQDLCGTEAACMALAPEAVLGDISNMTDADMGALVAKFQLAAKMPIMFWVKNTGSSCNAQTAKALVLRGGGSHFAYENHHTNILHFGVCEKIIPTQSTAAVGVTSSAPVVTPASLAPGPAVTPPTTSTGTPRPSTGAATNTPQTSTVSTAPSSSATITPTTTTTTAPATTAPAAPTSAVPTSAGPASTVPASAAQASAAPASAAPASAAPATTVPASAALATTAPASAVPASTAPAAPTSAVPTSAVPASTAPASAAPATAAPASAVPTSAVPASTAPASAVPAATAPASTAPASAVPASAPASAVPASTAPASTAPASAVPASTAPASAAPASAVPASAPPASAAPASAVPASAAPASAVPASAAPASAAPASAAPALPGWIQDPDTQREFIANRNESAYPEASESCRSKMNASMVFFTNALQYLDMSETLRLSSGHFWVGVAVNNSHHECLQLRVVHGSDSILSKADCRQMAASICSRTSNVSDVLENPAFVRLLADMKVDSAETTRSRRKLVSVYEERKSATAVGSIGVLAVVSVVTLIALLDLTRLKCRCRYDDSNKMTKVKVIRARKASERGTSVSDSTC